MAVETTGDPRGGEALFKITWSVVAFGIGPLSAAAFPVAVGRRWLEPEVLVLAIAIALAIYGFTVWATIDLASQMNDCLIGVPWPDTSEDVCD